MDCPSCGASNSDGAEVCFTCGRPLALAARAIRQGSLLANRYEILKALGQGGMGAVYKAHDRMLDETVAIKVLRPEIARDADLARRFQSEIKLARKITHRNVCRIHEYGEDEGLRYISMEFIEGIDLRQVLQAGGGLPPEEAFAAALQVCEGLAAIHEMGVIHRDLKTPNIMKDARGVLKLMDFGIAKQWGADATATATGMVLGTPEYMSPEQARGEKIDFRSDVYALGVVIFEIFTGRVPFRAETPLGTILKHLQEAPPLDGPAAARLPGALKGVLRRALAKSAGERYPTIGEMTEALREARDATLGGRAGGAAAPAPAVAKTVAPRGRDAAPVASIPPASSPAAIPLAPPALRPRPARSWILPLLLAGLVVLGAAGAVGLLLARGALSPAPLETERASAAPAGPSGPPAVAAEGRGEAALGGGAREPGASLPAAAPPATLPPATPPPATLPPGTRPPAPSTRPPAPALPASSLPPPERPAPSPSPAAASASPPRPAEAAVSPQVRALEASLRGPSVEDRWRAAEALGNLASQALPAVPALVAALDDRSEVVRWRAAEALGKLGPGAAGAVAALVGALGDKDGLVRTESAKALGLIGAPAARPAVPALASALRSSDVYYRREVAKALARIADPESRDWVPPLVEGLRDKDKFVRLGCARALGRIGPAAKDAVAALETAARDKEPLVSREAAAALDSIRGGG